MPRIAYVNGRYVPLAEARVGVEDRAFQFADGVYEVAAVLNGRLLDWDAHLARLRRSMGELAIAAPMGVRVVSVADGRWSRPDIKSVSLLPNVLAKEAARAAGAGEAWFVDAQGYVTEGGSTNAWIVDASGALRIRPADGAILAGVMRATLLRVAAEAGVAVEERAFSLAEARAAREAFLTSTTNPCVPVVALDGAAVGDGRPGPVTGQLAAALWAKIGRQTGWEAIR